MAESFGLYLVLTDPVTGYAACVEAAVRAGVRYVQLRMKHHPREEVLKTALVLSSITWGSPTRFIVNDDPELAVESEADGVHLGQDDMPIDDARRRYATLACFGLSTHNETQAKEAKILRPDYIGIGPVFSTPTKAIPDPTVGLARMGRIISLSPLTCVAIGGIDANNLPAVLKAGAVNFAVVRAVCQAPDPYDAIRRLQDIWAQNT